MNIVMIECPKCGGTIERKADEYFGKCPYCGMEVGFNELKAEVQVGQYKDQLNAMEQRENSTRQNREKLQSWVKLRNILFVLMGLFHFFGIMLVCYFCEFDQDENIGFGMLLVLPAWIGFFTIPSVIGFSYPEYNALYDKTEKGGKWIMWLKLSAVAFGLLLATGILAMLIIFILFAA